MTIKMTLRICIFDHPDGFTASYDRIGSPVRQRLFNDKGEVQVFPTMQRALIAAAEAQLEHVKTGGSGHEKQ